MPQLHPVLIGPNLLPVTSPPLPDSVAAKTLRPVEGMPNGPPFLELRIATQASTPDAKNEIDSTDGKYPLAYFTLRSVVVATHHRFRREYLGTANIRGACLHA